MIDVATLIATVLSSAGVSAATAHWLSKALLTHRLTKALEDHKAKLAKELETQKAFATRELEDRKCVLQSELVDQKAIVEGAIKREVDLYLADSAAQRAYEWEARKRLYTAIGPLRFQLLMACRAVSGRLVAYAEREHYSMRISGYYGRSTLYRILRPLAISELIERQIAYADFAVDALAIECLRFKQSAFRIFSGHEIVANHPRLDWSREIEHAFVDSIVGAANALLVQISNDAPRVMRFDEFAGLQNFDAYEPFVGLLDDFDMARKPVLWVRLVAYGNACNAFVSRAGQPIGFETRAFDVPFLLSQSDDSYIVEHANGYAALVEAASLVRL